MRKEVKMNSANALLDFIKNSPSCFHAVKNIQEKLLAQGFEELDERKKWNLQEGKNYFVTRNNSSIISFKLSAFDYRGFLITASHSDSPSFKIKENPEIKSEDLTTLNVERYGGMLIAPWFDRALSIAGRILVKNSDEKNKISLKEVLVNFDKDLVTIPNLAIHMNREANEGHHYDIQNELRPVISADKNFRFKKMLADQAGVKEDDIVSYDLFLYNRDQGKIWGQDGEFIISPKLDDLECAYTCLEGFLSAAPSKDMVQLFVVFDNEEVGSESRQGAGSTFLQDTLRRINECCGRNEELYHTAVANSFLVSADNAHALHPNYVSAADPVNRPQVNGGPVIKFNAAQKYTSDAVSASVFKQVCEKAKVPYQIFTNNSNCAGGSTLGNISNGQVSILSVDIGIAQWAMHSPNESAGSKDVDYMIKAIKEFYSSELELN